MPAGENWVDETPAPVPVQKQKRRWPDKDGTGIVNVQAGESLAQAIQREGPINVFRTAIPFAARVTLTMRLEEE